jgi:hypothetical protein
MIPSVFVFWLTALFRKYGISRRLAADGYCYLNLKMSPWCPEKEVFSRPLPFVLLSPII